MPYTGFRPPTAPDPVQTDPIGTLGAVNEPDTVWYVAVGRSSLWMRVWDGFCDRLAWRAVWSW